MYKPVEQVMYIPTTGIIGRTCAIIMYKLREVGGAFNQYY